MIPRWMVDNYTVAINRVSSSARAAMEEAYSRIDVTGNVGSVREATIVALDGVCKLATDTVAGVSIEFYNACREHEIGGRLNLLAQSGRDPVATREAVHGMADALVERKYGKFHNNVISRVDYEVKVAAAESVLNASFRDPARPRFARVPTGDETCDFCIMLASRGFVYHNATTASHSHANCDCRIVPAWSVSDPRDWQKVEGYNPNKYLAEWVASVFTPKQVPWSKRRVKTRGKSKNSPKNSRSNRRTSSIPAGDIISMIAKMNEATSEVQLTSAFTRYFNQLINDWRASDSDIDQITSHYVELLKEHGWSASKS